MNTGKCKWVISKRDDKRFYFTLIGSNGQTIMASKGYHNRFQVKRTINTISTKSPSAEIIDTTKQPCHT